MRIVLSLTLFIIIQIVSFAQSSSNILEDLERFKSFGTVLYMAAHPDDENTRVIAWLANGEHAKTAYLSLTRGDGGQNLIGDEFGDALGILRTQELLAARSLDGGEQYFTSAVDFGYSRSADETLNKWGEENILADVVYMIRKFKPQIIITRFPPDERGGHGHHTASAMLAIKGAEQAGDASKFPDQLNVVEPWQVQSVYWNTSTWWDKKVAEDAETDESIWRANIGGYNANMGKSYNEIGSVARSQHKCQGFGVAIDRGEKFEYFRHLWGEKLPDGLEGVSKPTWSDLGIQKVEKELEEIEENFNPRQPQNSLDALLAVYKKLANIEDEYWRNRKMDECGALIKKCGGLFVEANADQYYYVQGDKKADVTVNFLSRQTNRFAIDGLQAPGGGMVFKAPASLDQNKFSSYEIAIETPDYLTHAYWLAKPHGDRYDMSPANTSAFGLAQNPPTMRVSAGLLIDDVRIPISIPVKYKWRDRVEGEQQREVVVVPPFALTFNQPMVVSLGNNPVEVMAKLKWFLAEGTYNVTLKAEGWNIDYLGKNANNELTLELDAKGLEREQDIKVILTPLQVGNQSHVTATSTSINEVRGYQEIAYPHIPTQLIMPAVNVSLTSLDVKTAGNKVGYIQGAGDQVAESIKQLGYVVDILDADAIANTDLTQYQAIVVGIRAYNTQSWLQNHTEEFFSYVKAGGNFIVQYNTASRFLGDKPLIPAPYSFDLGRGRVTEEDSEVEFLLPKHPVLNAPNKITQADFEGWVQERGLYFASKWDDNFAAPIGWNDRGKEQEQGGLIIANYGEGAFMYTGISFFRVLPKGVPGAYRLLANLISYEAK